MISLAPFRAPDLTGLTLQPAQAYLQRQIDAPDYGPWLAATHNGTAWTARRGGRVVGCGGLSPQWPSRAIAWVLLSRIDAGDWMALHRLADRMIEASPFDRIEAAVPLDFADGQRWCRLLGFYIEGLARCYLPDGRDCLLYARLRGAP